MQIDDDILQCREDLMRIMKKNTGQSDAASVKTSKASPVRQKPARVMSVDGKTTADGDVTDAAKSELTPGDEEQPALIRSFEDLTAKEPAVVDAAWETTPAAEVQMPVEQTPLSEVPKDDWTRIADDEKEALTGSVNSESGESILSPDAIARSSIDHNDHSDPLAIIGSAVKQAEQDHDEEELAAKAGAAKADSESIATDEFDLEISGDDAMDSGLDLEVAELEEQLREIGIDDEDDEEEVQIDSISEIDVAVESLLSAENVELTSEEKEILTADLNEVGVLLETADDGDEENNAVPQFDLAEQILAEQRKSVAAQRKGPAGRKSTTRIAPASGTVGKVISENKKSAAKETPSLSDLKTPQTAAKKDEPVEADREEVVSKDEPMRSGRNTQSSPAVMNIVCGEDNLSSFQRQIVSEIIARDISLHCDIAGSNLALNSYMNN